MQCVEEWTINLPPLLEYINIAIIHDFLLRVYVVIHERLRPYKKCISLQTGFICLYHILNCVVISLVYCQKVSTHSPIPEISIALPNIVQAGFVIAINPVIVILVLHSLYGKVGRRHREAGSMFIKILLLGIIIQIGGIIRIILLFK